MKVLIFATLWCFITSFALDQHPDALSTPMFWIWTGVALIGYCIMIAVLRALFFYNPQHGHIRRINSQPDPFYDCKD